MKKQVVGVVLMALLSVVMYSCRGGKSPFEASGKPLEMVVVLPDAMDDDATKEAVREAFAGPIGLLPQPEPLCDVTITNQQNFKNLFKRYRNILYIDLDPARYTKAGIHKSFDEFAKGQLIITLRADSKETVNGLLKHNNEFLGQLFYDHEMERRWRKLEDIYSTPFEKAVQDSIGGVTINVYEPIKTFPVVHKGFVWGTNDDVDHRIDMVVYEFPYTDEKIFSRAGLMHKRDSVMMENILGKYLNSYMTTERRVDPLYTHFTVNGQFRAELRGLWAMTNDMMGGPFVMHAVVDETSHRVIVAETFVYAPGKRKRNALLEGEAGLFTLRPIDATFESDKIEIKR